MDLQHKIANFIKSYPQKNVSVFCTKNKITLGTFYSEIYKILSSFFAAGESLNYKGEYDPEQLAMGTEIELEHTTNRMISERIAKDHLAEIPDYYTRLKHMEEEADE